MLSTGSAIETTRNTVGREYFNFLVNGFDPGLSWLDLNQTQRLVAQGFVVGKHEAVMANDEFLLPRQESQMPMVEFSVIDVKRDEKENHLSYRQIIEGYPLDRLRGAEFLRCLSLESGPHVMVFFDTRAARDALLESFDNQLERWVGDWQRGMKKAGKFPIHWDAAGEGIVYWNPQTGSKNVRAKRNEYAIIPSDDPGFAILLVSMRHNPSTVRAGFHTHLKAPLFKKWHRNCVGYWKGLSSATLEIAKNPDDTFALDREGFLRYVLVRRPLFDAEKDLPPKKKRVKSAHRSNLWLGLAAHDVVAAGVSFGKKTREGAFLLRHCQSYTDLKNHYRSAARRLRELEKEAKTFH